MWVVRIKGDKFHCVCENSEEANKEVDRLSRIGITASYKFEDNITKKTLDSSINEKIVKDHSYCSFCCDRLTKEHCIGCDNNEQEQFAKKMLAIMKTRAFKDFYSGNWHFLNDEEAIKVIQKLF